ncbi:hypothetical protein ACTNDP_16835 [Paenibacillus barengoltzii]
MQIILRAILPHLAQGYAYRDQPIIVMEFGGIAFQSEWAGVTATR